VRFSPDETTLLNLAAMVWREGSLSGESKRALLKLRSLGVSTTEPVLGYAPRIRMRDAAFEPLSAAIDKHVLVGFEYLKPGEQDATNRTVAPLALIQHQGRWHLFALEPDTGVTKTFLLRRIVSDVTVTSKSFDPPPGDQAARGLADLETVWNDHVALVEVEPGTDAAARLGKRRGASPAGADRLELHFVDTNILADELAGFGPEVLVLAPDYLRDAVRERLETTAADHG
jgi:proteasome accessory factor B